MKNSSATIYSPAMELPVITKRFTRRSKRRKITKETEPVESMLSVNTVPPPSDELVERLNRIGQEYPFCVYYKQKVHDPL